MNKQAKKTLLFLLAVLLAGELAFLTLNPAVSSAPGGPAVTRPASTAPAPTVPAPIGTSAPFSSQPLPPETAEATQTAPTETQPQRFLLTFTGDCTLGSTADRWNYGKSFVQTIKEDYSWPFANVREYFEADDFTAINLEGTLTDTGSPQVKEFVFRGPPAYTAIMTGSSVEAVTLANNHSMDYGQAGYNQTTQVLKDAGITYVERDKTALFTTESGLCVGLYGASFTFKESTIRAAISQLRSQGAEIVICAFHWGKEGSYRTTGTQEYFGRLAIDAGADIVWGHHPHVLQKIEHYGNGVIYYSLGNFSFGGATYPKDYDSAFLQQEVIRDPDGTVRLGTLTAIPVSLSSTTGWNNYQPTPMEPDSEEYKRVMSKLDGTFTGPDLPLNVPTEPPATAAPTAPTATQPGDSPTAAPTAPSAAPTNPSAVPTNPPAAPTNPPATPTNPPAVPTNPPAAPTAAPTAPPSPSQAPS